MPRPDSIFLAKHLGWKVVSFVSSKLNRQISIVGMEKTIIEKWVFLTLLNVFCSYGIAQEHEEQKDLARHLENHLTQQAQSQNIPGLSAVVVRNGELIYLEALGVKDINSREELTPDHVLPMASISKTFVAAAIAQLVESDQLDLNAPVTSYLPYFRLTGNRQDEIKISQLLNHTSGMPDATEYGYDDPKYDEGALEQWVREMDQLSLVSDPGAQWGYSDLAFEILGDVIAKVSGQSFEQYMQTNLFSPLGMKDSSFLYPDAKEELRTSGHLTPTEVSNIYPYNRRHAPSSSLQSNARDMALWVQAHLNTGELNGRRILDSEAFGLLWEPTFDIAEGVQIGLAWLMVNINGHRAVMHNGSDIGFQTQIMLFPDENTGFVIASNLQGIDMRAISSGLTEILLN